MMGNEIRKHLLELTLLELTQSNVLTLALNSVLILWIRAE